MTKKTPEELEKLTAALKAQRPSETARTTGMAAAMAAFDAEFSDQTEKSSASTQGSSVGARPIGKDAAQAPLFARVSTAAKDKLMTFSDWISKPQTRVMGGSAVAILLAGVVFLQTDLFDTDNLPGSLPPIAVDETDDGPTEPVVKLPVETPEPTEPVEIEPRVDTPSVETPVAPEDVTPEPVTTAPTLDPVTPDPTPAPAGLGYTDIVVERKIVKAPARVTERTIPSVTQTVEREITNPDGTVETISEIVVTQEAMTELVNVPPAYDTVRETLRVRADGSSEVIASDVIASDPVPEADTEMVELSAPVVMPELAPEPMMAPEPVVAFEPAPMAEGIVSLEGAVAESEAVYYEVVVTGTSSAVGRGAASDSIRATSKMSRETVGRARTSEYSAAPPPVPSAIYSEPAPAPMAERVADVETREVPPVTKEVERRVIKTPAATVERTVPAVTKDVVVDITNVDGTVTQITQTVIVQEAFTELVTTPPVYETVVETVILRPGSTEIIERDIDGKIIRRRPKPEPQPVPQAGLLTAGDYDDVLNPTLYKTYLDKTLQGPLRDRDLPYVDANRRIGLRIVDRDGDPLPFATVSLRGNNGRLDRVLRTGANGLAYLYPAFDDLEAGTEIRITSPRARTVRKTLSRSEIRKGGEIEIEMRTNAKSVQQLDLLLTLDATGSMGDEMRYLQRELQSILNRVEDAHPGIDIRTGLIVYRDKGDDYVVREIPFTSDAQAFRETLAKQRAAGGGDTPEAMHTAMETGLQMDWREDALKINLLVADAPPHRDKIAQTWAAGEASRAKGIHIVPLAASGVDKSAEFLMRAMAQLTGGRFLFLTDDSGIGNPHAEPSVDCYIVTKLDGLVTRVLSSLIAGERVEPRPGQVIRSVGDYNAGVCEVDAPDDWIVNTGGQ
jgi:hypothetical protein